MPTEAAAVATGSNSAKISSTGRRSSRSITLRTSCTGMGGHAVLKLSEFFDILGRKQIGARAHELPQLDEARTQFLENQPDSPRGGKPRPEQQFFLIRPFRPCGLPAEKPFDHIPEAVLEQHARDGAEPRDLFHAEHATQPFHQLFPPERNPSRRIDCGVISKTWKTSRGPTDLPARSKPQSPGPALQMGDEEGCRRPRGHGLRTVSQKTHAGVKCPVEPAGPHACAEQARKNPRRRFSPTRAFMATRQSRPRFAERPAAGPRSTSPQRGPAGRPDSPAALSTCAGIVSYLDRNLLNRC